MKKSIALTFDDGPNTTTTIQVLDKLKQYGVKASFFLIGDNIKEECKPVVKRAYEMGCEINNHSKTHPQMPELSADEMKAEIKYTSELIQSITGETPHFFRPPYINVNDVMFDSIDLPFICGYGGEDWVDEVTSKERYEKIMDQVKDGGIILLHDMEGNQKTVDALDLLIPELLRQDYEFVTVSELFKRMGVQPQRNMVYSNATQTTQY